MAIKDSVTIRVKKEKWIFTKEQLEKFGKSINKYKKTTSLEDGKVVSIFDWDTIYFKAGVKTNDGRLTWYGSEEVKIFHMEKFDEMYRQWQYMKDGRDYASEKSLEQLSKTSQEIDADKVFEDY